MTLGYWHAEQWLARRDTGCWQRGQLTFKVFVAKGNTRLPQLCAQSAQDHQYICGEPHPAATGAMMNSVVGVMMAKGVGLE